MVFVVSLLLKIYTVFPRSKVFVAIKLKIFIYSSMIQFIVMVMNVIFIENQLVNH